MSFPKLPRRAAAALLVLVAACSSGTGVDAIVAPSPNVSTAERTGSGVQQRVTITPARPATGDTITIRSVLVNRGSAPATFTHVVCGLDYDPSTLLDSPFIQCAAYSARTTLAPNDSIVQLDRRVVVARAGEYTLRVRHLLEPATWWVDVPLGVRAR